MTALERKQRKELRKSMQWGRYVRNKNRPGRHPLLAAQRQRFSFSSRNNRSNPKLPVSIDSTTLAVIRLEVEEMLASSAPVTILSLANALSGCSQVLDVHAAAAEDILQDDDDALGVPERRFRGWRFVLPALRPKLENKKMQRKYALMHCFQKLQQQTGAATTPIACWKAAVAALDSVLILPEESQPEEQDATDENKTKKTDTTMADFQKRLQDIRLEETMGLRPSQHQWQQVAAQSSLFSRKHDDDALLASDQRRLAEAQAARKDRLQPPELRQIEEQQEREARAAAARERAASLLRTLSPEELARIDTAMRTGDDEDVLAETEMDACNRHSLRTLRPGTWVNDEAIHYFLVMLAKRDAQLCANDPKRRRSHFFKSFFMTQLRNEYNADNPGEYTYRNVKRWSKKVPGTYFCRGLSIVLDTHFSLSDTVSSPTLVSQARTFLPSTRSSSPSTKTTSTGSAPASLCRRSEFSSTTAWAAVA